MRSYAPSRRASKEEGQPKAVYADEARALSHLPDQLPTTVCPRRQHHSGMPVQRRGSCADHPEGPCAGGALRRSREGRHRRESGRPALVALHPGAAVGVIAKSGRGGRNTPGGTGASAARHGDGSSSATAKSACSAAPPGGSKSTTFAREAEAEGTTTATCAPSAIAATGERRKGNRWPHGASGRTGPRPSR